MTRKTVDVTEVIDSAKFVGLPLGIAVMMIIIMLADGYDLLLMGQVSNYMVKDWGISPALLKSINQAGLAGMAIGSIGLGWLGDRIGRKRSYITCLIFLFIGSVMCYYAAKAGTPDTSAATIEKMTLWRFVTGLGMGGVTPLATTLIAEWTSRRVRSVVVAFVICSVPVGGSLAAFAIKHVEWQQMFLIGGLVPLALFIVFGYLLPESPKFMAKHSNLHPRLGTLLNRLVGEKRFDGTEEFVVNDSGHQSKQWFATIWNNDFRRATFFIWMVFLVNSFVLYIFTNSYPTLLRNGSVSIEAAGSALGLFTFGASFGSIGGAFMIRWFGSRYVGTVLAFTGVIMITLMGFSLIPSNVPSDNYLLAISFIGGMAVNGMQAFIYAVAAHSYPTEIRAAAVGLAQGVSRISAVLSPTVVASYQTMNPMPGVNYFFWFVAGCALITTASFYLIPSQIPNHTKQN